MFWETTIRMCAPRFEHKHDFHSKVLPALELITGIALLALGFLGVYNILNMSMPASWILVGVGACYTGLIIYRLIEKAKRACCGGS